MATPRVRELAAFFGLSALWSGNWLFIKVGLRDLPPLRFAGMRLAIAFLLLIPFALAVRRSAREPVGRARARWIALVGLLQIGVSYACVYTAELWIDSGLTALLFCSFPIWLGLAGHWLLPEEPLTTRSVLAVALGVGGVGVIEAPAIVRAVSSGWAPLAAGGPLVVAAAVVSALSAVLIKKHLARVPAVVNVWGQALVAAVFLLGLSLAVERAAPSRWTVAAAGALAYLSIIGTGTFVGTQWLIPRLPVAVIGALPLVNTALALVWGALFAHETLSPRVVAGGALIFGGVFLVTYAPRPAPSPRLST